MKIDCHVHILGNGASGSGCWIALQSVLDRLRAALLSRSIGLPAGAAKGDLDQLYVEKLLERLRRSPLDRALILAQDQPYDERGRLIHDKSIYYVPNDYVLALARRYREFLPAASIHPGRPDALEELEKCLEGGARVLKLLPNCLNVDCSNPLYQGFWRRMAEAGMILLAHTGGEMTLPVIEHAYSDPDRLRGPLECGVTVIAAHAAGRSGLWDPDYTTCLLRLFERYPRLYADNSALSTLNRARTIKRLLSPQVLERIIYGSDYPVPVTAWGAYLGGTVDGRTLQEARRQENPFRRDVEIKRAAGFPDETLTRLGHLLSENART